MAETIETVKARTGVVIPAFNAADHLQSVIARASGFIPISHIIVVNDGSTDATGEVARSSGATVLEHAHNQGKGAALETGITEAGRRGFEFAITMDADGQHDPSEIPRFLGREAETGADIIVGNRMAERKDMPQDRIFANRVTSWFVSVRAGVHIPDSQNGYRLVRTSLYRQIRIRAKRYAAESELLIKAGRRGARMAWVPVATIYATERSSVNPVIDTLRFLRMAIRSMFW